VEDETELPLPLVCRWHVWLVPKRAKTVAPDLLVSETRKCRGRILSKSTTDLRVEAKRKLISKLALELTPQYSLYALRHSWATQALLRGVDPLTVAILMGHEDPSMLTKVYQHLSLNPKHMLAEAERATRVG
jgi:integrase